MKSTIASYTRINTGKIDQVDRMLIKDENVTEKSVRCTNGEGCK